MKRTYGNEKTALTLTGKALEFYNLSDHMTIIEDDFNGVPFYQVLSGGEPLHDGQMTEKQLIRWLEDGYNDMAVPVSFEAGEGRHFTGGVNYMRSQDGRIYAEIAVPDGASEDYGYLTMKNAITAAYHDPLIFWYDGQEENLAADADVKAPVYVDIEV